MAAIKRTKVKKRATVRIYYGVNKYNVKDCFYWTVPVTLAKQDVIMRGTMADALSGEPGVTIGCHLSNVALTSRRIFPHAVILPVFTKSRAVIVDKIAGGKPAHCWLYEHSAGHWVDLNDEDSSKEIVKLHPELEGKEFVLHAPRKRAAGSGGGGKTALQPARGSNEAFKLARGALGRAEKAGLLDKGMKSILIDDLKDVA
jgi:hypothetical protein